MNSEHLFYIFPGNYFYEVIPMTEAPKNEINRYLEKMNEYQLRIVLGFIKKLFRLDD